MLSERLRARHEMSGGQPPATADLRAGGQVLRDGARDHARLAPGVRRSVPGHRRRLRGGGAFAQRRAHLEGARLRANTGKTAAGSG